MVSFLQIENLSKSIGERILFRDITFGIYEGDKIGVIAPNGSGKTTFLNILAGEDIFYDGNLTFKKDLKIAFLKQNPEFKEDDTPLNYALPPHNDEDYDILNKTEKILHQLHIYDMNQKMGTMSGGQVKRVALAKTLLTDADLLILDEPTNHLDVELVEWLEDYLSRRNVTLILVTHDRYFLDKVCTKIIEIDDRNFYFYDGNFNYYLGKKEERQTQQTEELARIKNLLRKEKDWMSRQPQARGTKARYRIDRFYELEEKASKKTGNKELKLENSKNYIGKKIFEASHVSKKFGDKIILNDWNYIFAKNEKMGIIGANGAGKTTLIRLLLNEITPDSGFFDVGETVRWGYFSQEGIEKIDENKKVIDLVKEIAENVKTETGNVISASQFLTKFLFPPDTQQKLISNLSGGEKRRLNLATVLIKRPNFLILDEPTNDLDIPTLAVLEDYLINFNGCLIIVSHDRSFLDKTVEHILVMKGEGEIYDFPGNYSDYKQSVLQNKADNNDIKDKKTIRKDSDTRNKRDKARKLSYKEKKEFEELQSKVEKLNHEKEELEGFLNSGVTDHEKLMEASERIKCIIEEIDESEFRILELMEIEG